MKHEEKERCGVCEIPYFERNNYYYGKLMTVRDYFAEQCYFNQKRWLMNRMISGWGVVCGLDVKSGNANTVVITPGLAIDCCGREILICEEQKIELVSESSECDERAGSEEGERKLIICLEYRECKTEPVNLPPIACDQKEKNEFNRIRDSFRIRVRPASEVDPNASHERCCPLENKSEYLQEYLCECLKEGCPECPEHVCLLLAEITIGSSHTTVEQTERDKHQEQQPDSPTVVIDPCSKRRLVYGNPLLFDLIRCYHGDLPHVKDINWKKDATFNGATIPWTDFVAADGIYNNGIKVWFDRMMQGNTIHSNTFLVQVKMEDSDTGNFRYEDVPGEIEYHYEQTTGESIATFKFTREWIADVYLGYSSIREGGEFRVILKGDFILTEEEKGKPGKALDGNFVGGRLPSGNGTQGGDFESWFFVESKPEQKKEQKKRG